MPAKQVTPVDETRAKKVHILMALLTLTVSWNCYQSIRFYLSTTTAEFAAVDLIGPIFLALEH